MNKTDIIIPLYNEKDNLDILLNKIFNIYNTYEIYINKLFFILVDNGSTDETYDYILKAISNNRYKSNIKLIRIEKNIGYGNGIKKGLQLSNTKIVGWTHGDNQSDPEDIISALNYYSNLNTKLKQNIILKGKRVKRKKLSKIFSILMEFTTFIFTLKYLRDINAQPKIFDNNLKKRLLAKKTPDDFNLDLELLLIGKESKYEIHNLPVNFHDRFASEAKGADNLKNVHKVVFSTLKYLIERLISKFIFINN